MSDTTAFFTAGAPTISVSAESVPVGVLDAALSARIAAAKRRLLDGGLLQLEIRMGCAHVGEPDIRGRTNLHIFGRLTR